MALRQVMSPRRLAKVAAATGANVSQPAAANPAHQEGFYQGAQEGRLFNPAIRYIHVCMELIDGEALLWAERVPIVEERKDQENAEQLYL